ncbi:hypothetical protein TOPH_04035, partial [Tolypocladium ophioglossoides CBS 100239]
MMRGSSIPLVGVPRFQHACVCPPVICPVLRNGKRPRDTHRSPRSGQQQTLAGMLAGTMRYTLASDGGWNLDLLAPRHVSATSGSATFPPARHSRQPGRCPCAHLRSSGVSLAPSVRPLRHGDLSHASSQDHLPIQHQCVVARADLVHVLRNRRGIQAMWPRRCVILERPHAEAACLHSLDTIAAQGSSVPWTVRGLPFWAMGGLLSGGPQENYINLGDVHVCVQRVHVRY